MSFKITNNLQSGTNLAKVVYANQQPTFDVTLDDEIAFYKDGVLTSSPELTYKDDKLQTSGGLEVGGGLLVGSTSSHVQLSTVSNLSYIDFRSNPGNTGTTVDFDARIISIGGSTGDAQAELLLQSGLLNVASAIKLGGGLAKAFKIDYGNAPISGDNSVITITFTTGVFSQTPIVVVTSNTPTGSTGNQFAHVEEVTPTSFKVEYLGVAAVGTFINYIAIGL